MSRQENFCRRLRAVFTVVMASIALSTTNYAMAQKSVSPPDFAYPKTVSANAKKSLEKALAKNDGEGVLRSLIEYTTAENLITNENFAATASKIAEVAENEKDVVVKALLNVLLAEDYLNFYQKNRWEYDRRELPLSPLPDTVSQWSGDQFRLKIYGLFCDALSQPAPLQAALLSSYGQVIDSNDLTAIYFPTIYDFVAVRALEAMESWNKVGDAEPKEYCRQLRQRLLDFHKGDIAPEIYWTLNKDRGSKLDIAAMEELYGRYEKSEYSGDVLSDIPVYSLSLPNRKWLASKLTYNIGRFPDYWNINSLKNSLKSLTNPGLTVSLLKNMVSPGVPFKITVKSENCTSGKVSIYRVYPGKDFDYKQYKDLREKDKVAEFPVVCDSVAPFGYSYNIEASLDKIGFYVIVPTISGELPEQDMYQLLQCTDLMGLQLTGGNDRYMYLTLDPVTGKAVGNVDVEFNSYRYSKGRKISEDIKLGRTDADGWLGQIASRPEYLRGRYIAKKGASLYVSPNTALPTYYKSHSEDRSYSADGYTSLALYRPGDRVEFAFVVSSILNNDSSLEQEARLRAILKDANYSPVDTLDLTSDSYGRVYGAFILPKAGLTGRFSIDLEIHPDTDEEDSVGSVSFTVSDYKLPTYYVEVTSVKKDYPAKGDVTLGGRVRTYSDFPVAGAEVKVNLESAERMRWWFSPNGDDIYSTVLTTDQEGKFSVTFTSGILSRNTDSPDTRCFQAKFDAVSPTGESRTAEKYFTTGHPYMINLSMEGNVDVSRPFSVDIQVMDDEYKPVKGLDIDYKLMDDDEKVVAEGRFSTSDPVVDLSAVPAGEYEFVVCTADTAMAESQTHDVTIYRPTDKILPNSDALWIPKLRYKFGNDGKVKVLYGTGQGTTEVYALISYGNNRFDKRVLSLKQGYHELEIGLFDKECQTVDVTMFTVKDFSIDSYHVTLVNDANCRGVRLEAESFRDHLIPGTQETWSFRVVDKNGNGVQSALLLDVYNKALDELEAQYIRSPNFLRRDIGGTSYMITPGHIGSLSSRVNSMYKMLDTRGLFKPQFDYYGYGLGLSLYGLHIRGGGVQRKMMATAASVKEMAMEQTEALDDVVTMAYGATNGVLLESVVVKDGGESGQSVDTENQAFEYRDMETPLMMFRPMLTTDENGVARLHFTVPNANATWMLKMISWSEDLEVSSLSHEFIASKPLMVQPNAPRFMRAGDTADILAMVMNNADSTVSVTVNIELFDPVTMEVKRTEKFQLEVAAKASATVRTGVRASDTDAALGLRFKASTMLFADGEQFVIPVIPVEEQVIESYPFYMSPSQTEYSAEVACPDGGNAVFEYCGNPQWFVVTALPGLRGNSGIDANSAAAAIFSAGISSGIIKANPSVASAIKEWQDNPSDSVLVSMLERNQELKTILLSSTPWVNDARIDTERMARLSLLFDRKAVTGDINEAIAKLSKMYAKDGGWMWYPEASEPSMWTTLNILAMMGDLRQLECLPSDRKLDEMIDMSVKWIDKEVGNEFASKHIDQSVYIRYEFVRGFYPEIIQSVASKKVSNAVVQYLVANWKKLDLGNKPAAAIILYRHNYRRVAEQVLESMRQYSRYEPQKGMWFPSFDDQKPWWNMDKVAVTSLAMWAFQTVDPGCVEVERLTQWLILQKQAQNWGNSVVASQVVSSILNVAKLHLSPAGNTVFTLGGKTLNPSSIERLTGYTRMPLEVSSKKESLTVRRPDNSDSPAYSAIYLRYKANPSEIQAYSCGEVSVEKQLYRRVVTPDGFGWEAADSLKVGDRVKVQLVVNTKRDMEYVVIDDNRSAAFEPVDQLPGYIYSEGVAFYRENRDAVTNMFIPYMPKGTYLLTYELNVNNAGSFTSGLATIQSQYAPSLSAHSSGTVYVISE